MMMFRFVFLILAISAEFDADVRWTCGQDAVSIFVRTPQPFDGVVQTRSSTMRSAEVGNDPCRVQGFGTNVAVLKLKLSRDGDCGMVYDPETSVYQTLIDVHSHPVLIVEGDKAVNITCREGSASNDTADQAGSMDVLSSDFELRILSSRLPTDLVRYSKPYTLQVRRISKSRTSGFFVGQCQAQAVDGNATVQLTDPVGCALFKSILTDFSRRESVEEAEIPSMFRFPDAKYLRISCVVVDCEGKCEKRSCDSDASASSLLERTTSSVESEEVQRVAITVKIDDGTMTTTTSTTTTQIPIPIPAAESHDDGILEVVHQDSPTPPPNLILKHEDPPMQRKDQPTTIECVSEHDFKLLYFLCIFLAACSIVGFTMNIVLCYMLRRRNQPKPPVVVDRIQITKTSASSQQPDFWIDEDKGVPTAAAPYFQRQDSISSYTSFRKPPARRPNYPPSSEYGIPVAASRNSGGSLEDRSEVYRRPHPAHLPRPEVRHSNSTFMTHSTTMETDMDSQGSSANQASSYH